MSRFITNPCALRRLFRRDARGLDHARPLVDLTADHYGKLLGEAGGATPPAYSTGRDVFHKAVKLTILSNQERL